MSYYLYRSINIIFHIFTNFNANTKSIVYSTTSFRLVKQIETINDRFSIFIVIVYFLSPRQWTHHPTSDRRPLILTVPYNSIFIVNVGCIQGLHFISLSESSAFADLSHWFFLHVIYFSKKRLVLVIALYFREPSRGIEIQGPIHVFVTDHRRVTWKERRLFLGIWLGSTVSIPV